MTLLLDSSVLFQLERRDEKLIAAVEQISKQHSGRPHISFMTLVEFLVSCEGHEPAKKVKAKEFIWQFPVLHTTGTTALLLSALKYRYVKLGKQKSITDLFIASQALEHDLTLITRDNDFKDINEIKKVVI